MKITMTRRARYIRWSIAIALLCLGIAACCEGEYLQAHQRRNGDFDRGWRLFTIGTSLIGAGASLPFVRVWLAIVIAIASPFVAFTLAVFVVWSVIILNAIFRFL
jgi:hypothetical protein